MRVDYRAVLPEAVLALRNLDDVVKQVPLEPKLIALVDLRTSQLNGCGHSVSAYTDTARLLGEDEQRLGLLSVWQSADVFGPRERAALAWCEALTLLPEHGTADAEYEDLAALFAPEEIVALTTAVIAVNGWNRLRSGLEGPMSERERPREHGPQVETMEPRVAELARRLKELDEEIRRVREDYYVATRGPDRQRYSDRGTIGLDYDDPGIGTP